MHHFAVDEDDGLASGVTCSDQVTSRRWRTKRDITNTFRDMSWTGRPQKHDRLHESISAATEGASRAASPTPSRSEAITHELAASAADNSCR